eukprot:COSAG02_NODE_38381_length_429_cov_1.566667_1_plen_113_part_10
MAAVRTGTCQQGRLTRLLVLALAPGLAGTQRPGGDDGGAPRVETPLCQHMVRSASEYHTVRWDPAMEQWQPEREPLQSGSWHSRRQPSWCVCDTGFRWSLAMGSCTQDVPPQW